MATKAPKKPASSKTASKLPSKNGKAVHAGKNGDDPGQTYIKGTVDEPIPAMDRDLKSLGKLRRDMELQKSNHEKLLTQISKRMHENKLANYRGAGFSVVIVPTAETVKVKPAKDK